MDVLRAHRFESRRKINTETRICKSSIRDNVEKRLKKHGRRAHAKKNVRCTSTNIRKEMERKTEHQVERFV